MKMKKILAVLFLVLLVLSCAACTAQDTHPEGDVIAPGTSTEHPINFDANGTFGYEIITDTMCSSVVANGEYKYSYFESYENGHAIKFYASPTEMVIVETGLDEERYYKESYDDIDQLYTNPIERVFAELSELDFKLIEDGGETRTFEATKTVFIKNNPKIKYNMYLIQMDWIDGESYVYKYYEYADGSTLISAEAPDEINPMIDANTTWKIDISVPSVFNADTNEVVELNVLNISTGEAISPNGGEETTTEHTYTIRLHINHNGDINNIEYISNGQSTKINVIRDMTMAPPEINNEMTEIPHDELQGMLMMIYMLESII